MEPVSAWNLIWVMALAYLSTYGLGALACMAAGLRLHSGFERLGVYCGVGAVIIGWAGYALILLQAPLVLRIFMWLASAVGAVMIAWRPEGRGDEKHYAPRAVAVAILGGLLALVIQRIGVHGMVRVGPEGALLCQGLWPDLLCRAGILDEFMSFDGTLQWPWLAGVELSGMSMLRFSAMGSVLSAAGLGVENYQHIGMWFGLYGIPVSAGAIFALFRRFGVAPMVAAVAVVLTAFLGNPRWLMHERFAHSPTLIWAGNEVFAFVFPAVYAALVVIFQTVQEFTWPIGVLGAVLVASIIGFGPWFSVAIIGGIGVWFVVCLLRKDGVRPAATLVIGAVGAALTLKFVCGTGAAEGTFIEAVGRSPVILSMSWAFPFLGEPLGELFQSPDAIAMAKLVKYVIIYLCAIGFFVLGTLWVRALLLSETEKWDIRKLRRPGNGLVACMAAVALALVSFTDFQKFSYANADYDMLRLTWVPLLLVNLALADYLYRRRARLRTWLGVLAAVALLVLGGWEHGYYILQRRALEQPVYVTAHDAAAIEYLNTHASASDTVLINPDYVPSGRDIVSHQWGYVSCLGLPRTWLGNREMVFRNTQQDLWYTRKAAYEQSWRQKRPDRQRRFIAEHDIDWIYVQNGEPSVAPDVGAELRFESGPVRLYQVRGR